MIPSVRRGAWRLAVVTLWVLLVPAVQAQDRLPPLSSDRMSEEQKRAVEEFRSARRAELTGPFIPLLRSPQLMNRVRALGDYLRFEGILPGRLREMVILITARHWTQQYEWNAHYRLALEGGLEAGIVRAIAENRRPDGMKEDETALYDLSTELHRMQGVSDATYAKAVGLLGEQAVVDAIGLSGYYTLLAMVLNTARAPLPDGVTPPLKPISR